MKVIFLDIDGVMNSECFYRERYKKRWFKYNTYKFYIKSKLSYIFNWFKKKYSNEYIHKPIYDTFNYKFDFLKNKTDPTKWKWLSELCNEYDYKICISSSWRSKFIYESHWNDALMRLGFNDSIFIGITGNRKNSRGLEIQEFLDSHSNIEDYVIIDDDSDMLPEQKENFFHVDGYYGISPNTIYKIHIKFNKLT